jgi:RNA polymerase sigma-70 factor (ECF subfamily)
VARLPRRAGANGPEGFSEREGFAQLYEQSLPSVLRYLTRETGHREIASDLAAEAYAKAFEKRDRFRGGTDEEARGWLWAIARNELRMYRRNRRSERGALKRLQPGPDWDDTELARIDETVTAEGDRESLSAALSELSADQQAVIRMHVIEEQDYSAIASELGVSSDVVRARLSRGLRRLGANGRLAGGDR